MAENELLVIESGEARLPYNYAVGLYGSKFFEELRDNKRIIGGKCPKCAKIQVPPRRVCGDCYKEISEFVEVGPKGVIGTFTIVRFGFIDPATGKSKPVPFGYGFVKFDGADNLFQHYIEYKDESQLKVGARVEPVFSEERTGTIKDIVHFRIID